MEDALRHAVEVRVGERRGQAAVIERTVSVRGGSIHRAHLVGLTDGSRFFLKWSPSAPLDMFTAEAEGLGALAAVGSIRVPSNAWPGEAESGAFLVMEAIEEGRPDESFFARFGRSLASLHRQSQQDRYGLDRSNYIGATPQPNEWSDDWVDFVRRHRLGFQMDLARERGHSDPTLDRLGDLLLDRLDEWLGDTGEQACLLHGDLWSGNFLVDERGDPVLIDPAVSYGQREADLAMTRLFGGFDRSFYAAYEEAWPLPPGTEERQEIYKLYHLLNHLNLFGSSYHGGCVEILRRLVG